jgi:hypothetical protein
MHYIVIKPTKSSKLTKTIGPFSSGCAGWLEAKDHLVSKGFKERSAYSLTEEVYNLWCHPRFDAQIVDYATPESFDPATEPYPDTFDGSGNAWFTDP